MLAQLCLVDDEVPRIGGALWTHDGILVAPGDEGLAFQPNPPVDWHQEILDSDERSGRLGQHAHTSIQGAVLIPRGRMYHLRSVAGLMVVIPAARCCEPWVGG
jgi:hypothetical protein